MTILRLRERALTAAVVTATVGVIVFAVLQYRWSTELIEATGVRMADTLQLSMANWQADFKRDFSEIAAMLQPPSSLGPDKALDSVDRRLAEWRRTARYPGLVDSVTLRHIDAPGMPGWHFEPKAPALVYALSPASELVVTLDRSLIVKEVMPDLANRYFQGTDGLDYEVAVATSGIPREVIYTSDAHFGADDVSDADGTMNIFGRAARGDTAAPLTVFHRTSDRYEPVKATLAWFPLPVGAAEADDWRLIVRHRRGGPLGAFVADMHQRDLMISFGALALLVLSMGMLIVTSSRAQRLATLQMDFVMAVSHEVRTPLTVIGSAADNIAQGVITTPQQIREYGTVIGKQAGQLSGLVEEILLFASTSTRPHRPTLTPVHLPEIVATTLAGTEELVRASQFQVERSIPADLPAVLADPVALSQVLQNLISNALKYGREGRWLGVTARVGTGRGGREVQISVSDRGAGIKSSDLQRIFEPFYRSASSSAAQIHGTGLGLTLARRMATAMRGDLTVASEPGRGSTFTLHLRCADDAPAVFTTSLQEAP